MNKVWYLAGCFYGFFYVGVSSAHAGLSADEVMNRNEDARRVNDVYSNARIVTGGPGMTERVKEFSWWRKLRSDNSRFNTLTRFKSPAEIKGEGILFLEQGEKEGKNEILMYLPAFKKIRRVESQQQSGSFMGSEFSYSDIAMPHAAEYHHRLLKEEPCGTGAPGVSCYWIESTPVSEEVRERTGYSKTVASVRADNFMVIQAEYRNLDGELSKKLAASDIQMVDPVKKKWMALSLRIENLKNGHFTSLLFKQVKVNEGLKDSIFTTGNLERI